MSSSVATCFIYLVGASLLFSGILAKPSTNNFSKDVALEETRGYTVYHEQFRANIQTQTAINFTGFRSAFQWTVGKSVSSNQGIQNTMKFTIEDATNATVQLTGEIGFNSKGSQIGVLLSMDELESNSTGFSFSCFNGFNFSADNNACFHSNFSMISNAIYYLDVEIREKTIRGYISIPVDNLNDLDDPYLPRYLIGEIKYSNALKTINPQAYWIGNYYGTSCSNSSDITTSNYQPQSYNKAKRSKRYLISSYYYVWCDLENTIIATDWINSVAVFISRPTIQINGTRTANYME